ncbi:MAG: hypothetical protein EBX50_02175 [Chitinophagia bacterium]|nr:hypothetical protein [Chitinophagia bacterium]
MRKLPWKKIISVTLWLLIGVGVLVLSGAALIKKGKHACKGIEVTLLTPTELVFVNETDIRQLLEKTFQITGKEISRLPLRSMELMLEHNPWIAKAEIYIDNNDSLHANLHERLPIARVFTLQQQSYYIDSMGVQLPLSDQLVARVPVFTDFPSDQSVLSVPDSMLLNDIIAISKKIASDSFWMAQISQIAIVAGNHFELYPITGRPIIRLGDGADLDEKFQKLNAYFTTEYFKMGYAQYPVIDVQFKRQLIGMRHPERMLDSTQFYQTVQGIDVKAAQIKVTSEQAEKIVPGTKTISNRNQPANMNISPSVSKDKNMQKTYNKTINSSLSKEVSNQKLPVSGTKKVDSPPAKTNQKKVNQ